MGHQIRSVGIALLGGHSNSAGKYELGIDSIRIVNEEDVGVDPREYSNTSSHPGHAHSTSVTSFR